MLKKLCETIWVNLRIKFILLLSYRWLNSLEETKLQYGHLAGKLSDSKATSSQPHTFLPKTFLSGQPQASASPGCSQVEAHSCQEDGEFGGYLSLCRALPPFTSVSDEAMSRALWGCTRRQPVPLDYLCTLLLALVPVSAQSWTPSSAHHSSPGV